MNRSDVVGLIRELGAEDWYGLYEVLWHLNTKYPTVAESEKVAIATDAMESLLASGEVQFDRAWWDSQRREPISVHDSMSLVTSLSSWQPPSHERDAEYLACGAA
jgi:hypothetical protein